MIFFTYLFKKSCSHENFSKIKTHIYFSTCRLFWHLFWRIYYCIPDSTRQTRHPQISRAFLSFYFSCRTWSTSSLLPAVCTHGGCIAPSNDNPSLQISWYHGNRLSTPQIAEDNLPFHEAFFVPLTLGTRTQGCIKPAFACTPTSHGIHGLPLSSFCSSPCCM